MKSPFAKIANFTVLLTFFVSTLSISKLQAGEVVVPIMPKPGTMVSLSPIYSPAFLNGVVIHEDNALQFDFLIHKGDGNLDLPQKNEEYTKLVKYFLASLTIPDSDQWVNLSPYEHDRIIKDNFGKTEMGRDLLAQDYLLKQITSSLMYPESGLGKEFWNKVYERAAQEFGNVQVPVNTFNKVWIVPDEALVYESGNTAYVVKSHLKVMLEEDYLSLEKHSAVTEEPNKVHAISSKMIREIILPALEKEVNEGKNFAQLRQIFSGMVLATWYKKALKESMLGKIYADKAKVIGVNQDPTNNEKIYQQYLVAFKKGVYNYIKEDVDKYTKQIIPRKYFSGGFEKKDIKVKTTTVSSQAMASVVDPQTDLAMIRLDAPDAAMAGDGNAKINGGDYAFRKVVFEELSDLGKDFYGVAGDVIDVEARVVEEGAKPSINEPILVQKLLALEEKANKSKVPLSVNAQKAIGLYGQIQALAKTNLPPSDIKALSPVAKELSAKLDGEPKKILDRVLRILGLDSAMNANLTPSDRLYNDLKISYKGIEVGKTLPLTDETLKRIIETVKPLSPTQKGMLAVEMMRVYAGNEQKIISALGLDKAMLGDFFKKFKDRLIYGGLDDTPELDTGDKIGDKKGAINEVAKAYGSSFPSQVEVAKVIRYDPKMPVSPELNKTFKAFEMVGGLEFWQKFEDRINRKELPNPLMIDGLVGREVDLLVKGADGKEEIITRKILGYQPKSLKEADGYIINVQEIVSKNGEIVRRSGEIGAATILQIVDKGGAIKTSTINNSVKILVAKTLLDPNNSEGVWEKDDPTTGVLRLKQGVDIKSVIKQLPLESNNLDALKTLIDAVEPKIIYEIKFGQVIDISSLGPQPKIVNRSASNNDELRLNDKVLLTSNRTVAPPIATPDKPLLDYLPLLSKGWDYSIKFVVDGHVENGQKYMGREGDVFIFEPMPGIQMRYASSRIKEIKDVDGNLVWPVRGLVDSNKAMISKGKDFNKGGIDLNGANLNFEIKRDGKGVPLPLPQQDMELLNKIQGFVPTIIEIKPVTTLPMFSQLHENSTSQNLASAS